MNENKNAKGSCFVCFRDDAIKDPNIMVGVMIAIEYRDNCFSILRVNWGPESEWECPFDGAVEQHWLFFEEETKELMRLTGTHNGQELVQAIYNRFKDQAQNADYYIAEWCDAEGIDYNFYYHRQMTEHTIQQLQEMRKEKPM